MIMLQMIIYNTAARDCFYFNAFIVLLVTILICVNKTYTFLGR